MPDPSPTFAELAREVGLDFGFCTARNKMTTISTEAAFILDQATIVADENNQTFTTFGLRPSQATFDWFKADWLVNWAKANGKRVVQGGHLVWDQFLPSWLTSITNPTTLRGVMEDHIHTVISHYGTDVSQWNVLNEALSPSDGNPGNFRTGHWFNVLGVDYAKWAFQAAAAVCPPGVELIYNCGTPAWYEVEFVRSLLDAGVRVDGVGFQMHLWNSEQQGWPATEYYVSKMNEMAALGLDIYITELDVRDNFYPLATRDADCANAFTFVMGNVFREVERLKHVLWWGVDDSGSWNNFVYPRTNGELTGSALLYGRDGGQNPLLADAFTRALRRRAPVRKFPQVPGSWSTRRRPLA